MASRNWSRVEVEAAVQDYLDMLLLELSGQTYNKSEHNRRLRERLDRRSRQSVEYKHANISAVLDSLGLDSIDGYKPRGNVQSLLRKVVLERIPPVLEFLARDSAAQQEPISVDDILTIRVDPPDTELVARQEAPEFVVHERSPSNANYVEQEARNQSLGDAGEALIMTYEQSRLEHAGKDRLARSVEQVSKTQGDHLGYDIHSYEENGRDRFVEVKTTRYGKRTPFYISAAEIRFSEAHSNAYQLYRVFDFRKRPKLFTLPGYVAGHVTLRETSARSTPGAIADISARPSMPRVADVSGAQTAMQSASSRKSGRSSGPPTMSTHSVGCGLERNPTTCMPKILAFSASARPVCPRPTIRSVFPLSGTMLRARQTRPALS